MRRPIVLAMIAILSLGVVVILNAAPRPNRPEAETAPQILFGFTMTDHPYCELPKLSRDQVAELGHGLAPETFGNRSGGEHPAEPSLLGAVQDITHHGSRVDGW